MRYAEKRPCEGGNPMAAEAIFSKDVFQFFKDLGKHNKKTWMDANRERYQETVTKPFRKLLQEVSPALLKVDPKFDVMARSGGNFSRINRDIRFAKDKTPYHPHMYLKVSVPSAGEMEGGELYVGIAAEAVTAGFRIYAMPKRKLSPIALLAEPKLAANPRLLAQQKRRLGKKYESYWYCKYGLCARSFRRRLLLVLHFLPMLPKSSATCTRY